MTPANCPTEIGYSDQTDLTPRVSAMLLAAGRGERMRPLTDGTPKPMLKVHGKALLQWQLDALARAGVAQVVINTAWLGEQISDFFGASYPNPSNTNVSARAPGAAPLQIRYSHEGRDFGQALESAGGICRALPLLCPSGAASSVFWVVAGDIFAPDFSFDQASVERFCATDKLAHLWLVANPTQHPQGDFGLDLPRGLARKLSDTDPHPGWTYSAIGLYRRALFAPPWCSIAPGNPQGQRAALAALLRSAIAEQLVSAEIYLGSWTDVGTPQRWRALNSMLAASYGLVPE